MYYRELDEILNGNYQKRKLSTRKSLGTLVAWPPVEDRVVSNFNLRLDTFKDIVKKILVRKMFSFLIKIPMKYSKS